MYSPSKIKNPNFNAGLKNMTKLIRIGTRWQWPSLRTTAFRKIQRSAFTTPAIKLTKFSLSDVLNDGY